MEQRLILAREDVVISRSTGNIVDVHTLSSNAQHTSNGTWSTNRGWIQKHQALYRVLFYGSLRLRMKALQSTRNSSKPGTDLLRCVINYKMQRAFVSLPKIVRPTTSRRVYKFRALSDNSHLKSFVPLFPKDIIGAIESLETPEDVFEVTMDIGRSPTIRKINGESDVPVMSRTITRADVETVLRYAGSLDARNRTGVDGTLHRISAILNPRNEVIGLTCRVGRATPGLALPLHPVLKTNESLLIIGTPGSGKTSLLRDIAKTLADTYGKRVMIIDKSGEIAGHGDTPHEAIGSSRRLCVPYGSTQHDLMIEAVENHTPDVILVDEISTFQETRACQTIAERGVRLIGTAHGLNYENVIKNPALNQLVGGIATVTLGDAAAKTRGTQKTVTERSGPATFTKLIEIVTNGAKKTYEVRDTEATVDAFLTQRRVK